MATVDLPVAATIELVMQDILPKLGYDDDPAFKLFPIEEEDAQIVQWDQLDNYTGLMTLRGVNGEPAKVQAPGSKRYKMQPGYWGNFSEIDEKEALERREPGTFADVIKLDTVIAERLKLLAQMRISTQLKMIWDLLGTGTFEAYDATGSELYKEAYTRQTYTISTPWSTTSTSTPLLDFRTAIQAAVTGRSVLMNSEAKAFMNLKTANYLLNNSNAADLGGKRRDYGATFNSMGDINQILAANDLPQIEIYNEGYYPIGTTTFGSGTFTTFIPDNKIIIVGKRKDAAPLGKVVMTRNLYSEQGYGAFTFVKSSVDSQQQPVPFRITVTDGFNGGMKLYYPSAILAMGW